jgi:hypothetical protein
MIEFVSGAEVTTYAYRTRMGLTVAARADCFSGELKPISFAECQRGRRHDLVDVRPRSFCSAA